MKDKEQTKRKLLKAVGELIKVNGITGIKISQIAKKADVDRKLIYRYFGGVNDLIEAYVIENDYWMTFSGKVKEMIDQNKGFNSQFLITDLLQSQFNVFFSEQEMQNLIILEISRKSPLMQSIHNVREDIGRQFLELTDSHFNNSEVNFRAISALLVGGIYYSILHTRFNGGMICDIDINSVEDRNEIIKAIQQIVSWAYQGAEKKR